jgi:polysaccharide deacetylase 2 family uncharacterized protein YibQ
VLAGVVAAGLFSITLVGCSGDADKRTKVSGGPGSSYLQDQDAAEHVLARHWGDVPQSGHAARTTLDDAGGRSWPLPAAGGTAAVRCRVVVLPEAAGAEATLLGLDEALAGVGAGVIWRESLGRGAWRVDVGRPGRPTHTLVLVPPALAGAVRWNAAGDDPQWSALADATGPLVALVIDDWGQRLTGPPAEILALPVPLTLAVLPGLPRSREVAALATALVLPAAASPDETAGDPGNPRRRRLAAGCPVEASLAPGAEAPTARREVFLHLPMQPLGYPATDPGPDALLVGMEANDVVKRLDRALQSVPGARGVNNHMGSAATADTLLMAVLMGELDRRSLRFLDSLTSSRSVAYREARSAGVPALRNRLFLDVDHQDEAAITASLEALVAAARARGQAVGIGHPHAATAAVLARELPRYAAEGVRFVTISEMIALQTAGASREGALAHGR